MLFAKDSQSCEQIVRSVNVAPVVAAVIYLDSEIRLTCKCCRRACYCRWREQYLPSRAVECGVSQLRGFGDIADALADTRRKPAPKLIAFEEFYALRSRAAVRHCWPRREQRDGL